MNIKDITAEWLKTNGYDGLVHTDYEGCDCGLDDFMPCDEPGIDCQPAYRHECDSCKGQTVEDESTVYCERGVEEGGNHGGGCFSTHPRDEETG